MEGGATMIAQTLLSVVVLFTAVATNMLEEDTDRYDFEVTKTMRDKIRSLEKHSQETNSVDITHVIVKFVLGFEKEYNTEVMWIDMKSSRNEMKAIFGAYKTYEMQLTPGIMNMSTAATKSTPPSLLYTNLYENNALSSQTYSVNRSSIRKESSAFKVNEGVDFSFQTSMTGSSKEKPIGGSGTATSKMDWSTGTTDTHSNLKMFSVMSKVTVKPGRVVRLDWYASTAESDYTWTCDINVGGHFAMGLKKDKPVDGTSLIIVPSVYLASATSKLKVMGPRSANFKASGRYNSIRTPSSDIYTSDVTDTIKNLRTQKPEL